MAETEKKEDEEIEQIEDEESGLEEDLEIAETNIDEDKFQDILINTNPNSPSLEQVAFAPEPLTSLEMGLSNAPITKKDEGDLSYKAVSYDEKGKDKSYSEMQKQSTDDYSVKSQMDEFKETKTHDPFQKSKEAYKI